MWIADWTARAACKDTDPDELFVQGAAQNRAKLICRGCVVRTECLADALDNRIEFGVWGGMTERERRALLRRRPDVTSWHELLENARNAYERTADDPALVATYPGLPPFGRLRRWLLADIVRGPSPPGPPRFLVEVRCPRLGLCRPWAPDGLPLQFAATLAVVTGLGTEPVRVRSLRVQV